MTRKGTCRAWGGIETPGSFGLTQAPDVNVPECVLKRVSGANDMVCVSACEEMGHGPTQTGDVGRVTDGAISETAPAPRDAVCEIRSASCKPPKHRRLHCGEPVLERPVIGMKPPRGRLKWKQIELCEFGKHVAPGEHVYRGPRGARREYCSWDAQSRSPGRHSRFRMHCKAVRVRVTSPGIAQHEVR